MPRNRIHVFITGAELCALLAEQAPKHAAGVHCLVGQPTARLANVPLSDLAAFVAHECVRELYLTLPNAGPDHAQDFNFDVRNRKSIVRFEIGAENAELAVEPTTIATDPDGSAMVLLREFERALSRLCHHYVRIPQTMRLEKRYWSPALAGRQLLGREAVLDDVAKVERARAASKRKPKWKPREPASPGEPTLRKEGKAWYGSSVDDLRRELMRFSGVNGYPADVFFEPSCPCHPGQTSAMRILGSSDDSFAVVACRSCGQSQVIGSDTTRPAAATRAPSCGCALDERDGQVLVAGSLLPGSQDVRWLYVGWRALVCGRLRVAADWMCDGAMSWPAVVGALARSTPRRDA